jgi:hypothetical protein
MEADKGNVERSTFNVQRAEGWASKAERERLVIPTCSRQLRDHKLSARVGLAGHKPLKLPEIFASIDAREVASVGGARF